MKAKIAVISPKSGAGASTFSHILGCFIKQQYGKKPLCVDLSYNKTLVNLQGQQSNEEKMYDVTDSVKNLDYSPYDITIFDTQLNKRNISILEKEQPHVIVVVSKPTKLDVEMTCKFIDDYPNFKNKIYLIYNAFMANRKTQKECLKLYNHNKNNIIKNRMLYETIMNENISLFTEKGSKLSEHKPAINELNLIISDLFKNYRG